MHNLTTNIYLSELFMSYRVKVFVRFLLIYIFNWMIKKLFEYFAQVPFISISVCEILSALLLLHELKSILQRYSSSIFQLNKFMILQSFCSIVVMIQIVINTAHNFSLHIDALQSKVHLAWISREPRISLSASYFCKCTKSSICIHLI